MGVVRRDLSILLVTHNHAATIATALEGVSAQVADLAVEVVVADADSTDDTRERIRFWAEAEGRECRFLPAEPHLGSSYARAFAACRSRYVAVLEGHDVWIHPERLARLTSFLDRHQECPMVYNRLLVVDEGNGTSWVEPSSHCNAHEVFIEDEDLGLGGLIASFSASMYRSEALERLPWPRLADASPQDRLIESELARFGPLGMVPEVMSIHRLHFARLHSGASEQRLERTMQPGAQQAPLRAARESLPPALSVRRPLISVVVTSYEHELYVEEALESVLRQDVDDLEVVVVDDGSRDSSPLKIGAIDDARVRLLRLADNQGAAAALNLALQQVRGDYVAVMSSDDAWVPGKLAKQLAILAGDSEIEAVFTDARLVRADGSNFPADESPPYQGVFRQPNRSRGGWLRRFYESGNCLCHPSVLARRALYDRVGFYDNRLRQVPDFDMWIRMCKVARIWVLDQELVLHRRVGSAGNVSSPTADNTARALHEILWIGRSFFDGVTRDDLRDGFGDLMRNPEAESSDELACEQAHLLLTGPSLFSSLFRLLGVEKLHALLGRRTTRRLLREQYGITDVVLHGLASSSRVLYAGFEHRWEPSSPPAAGGVPAKEHADGERNSSGRPPSFLRCPAFGEGESLAPRIEVWAFCYNRRQLLPYFLAHYRRFAQRIVVCDNRSTDGSRDWLVAHGVEVLEDANAGVFDDRVLKDQKNSLWKASRGRADWVVVCDVDELVYVSDLRRRLAWCIERGISGIRLTGFNMVSDRLPQHAGQIYDAPDFQVGASDPLWANKVAIFRPDMIDEINYSEGAHRAAPEGRGWLYGDDTQFALLHYRFLGGVESFVRRCADCRENLSPGNRERRQSLHFLESEEQIGTRIAVARSTARKLFPPLY